MKQEKYIFEKLKITSGPLIFDGTFIKNNNGEEVVLVDYWYGKDNDTKCLLAAPVMLHALIAQMNLIANLHKIENQSEEISKVNHMVENAIKEATGETWVQLEELIK